MAFTVMMLVFRNPAMTPDQFKEHYENIHIPLMKSLAGDIFPLAHTRHYIQRAGSADGYPATVLTGGQSDFNFDCVSTLSFEDQAGFEKMSSLLSEPEIAPKVGEDCGTFMDAARTKTVIIGETTKATRG